jgi:nitroreductase
MEKSFNEAMDFRHACKVFDENKKISERDIIDILEAGRKSPSSFGMEPWKFLVIKNEELKAKTHELSNNLEKSGLKVELAVDQDIIDLLFSFSHPSQAAFERAPAFNGPYLPPMYS